MKEKFPDKNTDDSLEKELKYCKQLIDVIKGNEEICSYPKVQEKLNLLEESVTDDMEHLETSKDEDAKTGHKTADTSFFGYKTHNNDRRTDHHSCHNHQRRKNRWQRTAKTCTKK